MALKKIFTAVLAAALMLPLLALPAGALGPVSETLYAGIDVSEYQGEIDWEQVKAAGIEVAYIKSSQADFTDPEFTRNAAGAREAGVHFGFYHYLTAKTEEEAQVQARFFVQTIENTGYNCRPVMDFEDFSGLSDAEVNAIGLAFMEEVERLTGVTPVLYTDAYAANTLWDAAFGAYPLWAADYGPSEPEITAGHWSGWSGFQYADDGRVDGIDDAVDLDRFTSGVFLDGAEPEPDPDPDPEPDPDPDPEPETGYTTYTVRAGDTLWAIARRYGTTVMAIADANAIANPNLIYVGETLKIPTGTGGAGVSYTVRAGDTLWAIARRYGTTVAAIAAANAIANPNLIYVGEVLTIPS